MTDPCFLREQETRCELDWTCVGGERSERSDYVLRAFAVEAMGTYTQASSLLDYQKVIDIISRRAAEPTHGPGIHNAT